MNESHWVIQRATAPGGPWTDINVVATTTAAAQGGSITYADTTVVQATNYYYRVIASNILGDATVYDAPAVGFPNVRYDSTPSGTAGPVIWP